MTKTQQNLTGVAISILLGLLSWLTILPGTPQIYAPFNLVVILPMFLVGAVLGEANAWAAVTVVPIFFCLWCWPVLRGQSTLPNRSFVLLILVIGLSAFSLIVGRQFAIKYHGRDYVVGVAAISALWWALLGTLAWRVRRRPSFSRNLWFHTVLFAWLAWYAIPYLAELP